MSFSSQNVVGGLEWVTSAFEKTRFVKQAPVISSYMHLTSAM